MQPNNKNSIQWNKWDSNDPNNDISNLFNLCTSYRNNRIIQDTKGDKQMNREEIEGKMFTLIRENMEYRRVIKIAEGYAKDLEKNEEELRKLFLQLD